MSLCHMPRDNRLYRLKGSGWSVDRGSVETVEIRGNKERRDEATERDLEKVKIEKKTE